MKNHNIKFETEGLNISEHSQCSPFSLQIAKFHHSTINITI